MAEPDEFLKPLWEKVLAAEPTAKLIYVEIAGGARVPAALIGDTAIDLRLAEDRLKTEEEA
jgi:hypothetical protein